MAGANLKVNKKRCILKTNGTIVNIEHKGLECPTLITVEYVVNSNIYSIRESVKLKSELIKLWIIPIGQRQVPVLPNVGIGAVVEVSYNPNKPTEAFITDNIGIINC